jgi:hypothetical protein
LIITKILFTMTKRQRQPSTSVFHYKWPVYMGKLLLVTVLENIPSEEQSNKELRWYSKYGNAAKPCMKCVHSSNLNDG